MKILREQTSWIHTIFVTDGERISHEQERTIRREMEANNGQYADERR